MGYQSKQIRSQGEVTVDGRRLKLYLVGRDLDAIEPEVVAAAVDALRGHLPEPDEDGPPAGWLILHRNPTAAYALAYTWVWGNVLQLTAFAAGEPYLGCPDDDPTHFVRTERPLIGCIWELAPLEHERRAWIRHVFGNEVPDLAAYLADTLPDGSTEP